MNWIAAIQKVGSALKKGTSAASKPVDDVNARFKNVMDLINSKSGFTPQAPQQATNASQVPPAPSMLPQQTPQVGAINSGQPLGGDDPILREIMARYGGGIMGNGMFGRR